MEEADDFSLINVHIPFAGNIPGTDESIPFNEIADNLDRLPADNEDRPVLQERPHERACRYGARGARIHERVQSRGWHGGVELGGSASGRPVAFGSPEPGRILPAFDQNEYLRLLGSSEGPFFEGPFSVWSGRR